MSWMLSRWYAVDDLTRTQKGLSPVETTLYSEKFDCQSSKVPIVNTNPKNSKKSISPSS